MVDILSMLDLTSTSALLAAIGVFVGVVLAILELRNLTKTRQSELYMHLYQGITSIENARRYLDLLNMEWEDYDDFERKYGSDNNPDGFAKRYSSWWFYDGIGLLLKKKLVDLDMVYQLGGIRAIWLWKKWESIIKEQRKRYKVPDLGIWFEYLAKELIKKREQMGITVEVPGTYTRYTK